jgi:hypothetical protein
MTLVQLALIGFFSTWPIGNFIGWCNQFGRYGAPFNWRVLWGPGRYVAWLEKGVDE